MRSRRFGARRLLAGLAVTIALLAGISFHQAAAATDAAGFMTELGDRVLKLLNDKDTLEAQRREQFDKLADQAFDIPKIAQFVLGRYWLSASDEEKQQFVKTFEVYMVNIYWTRFREYAGIDFKVASQRRDGNLIYVTTEFGRQSGQPPVRIDWTIATVGDNFRIRDASLEGVSQALTYRQEFASVIERNGGSVSALIEQLRHKADG